MSFNEWLAKCVLQHVCDGLCIGLGNGNRCSVTGVCPFTLIKNTSLGKQQIGDETGIIFCHSSLVCNVKKDWFTG